MRNSRRQPKNQTLHHHRRSSKKNSGVRCEITGLSSALKKKISQNLDQTTYIVFDIETTGGNPEKNGITEICALKWHHGQIQDRYYTLVNPKIRIPPIVRKMTGITNQMVKNAPTIDQVMPDVIKFIGNDILVSHNTIGDMKFLRYFGKEVCQHEVDNLFLCTHLLVEKIFPDTPQKSLQGLAKTFEFEVGESHRADADAQLTLDLFKLLLDPIKQKGIETVEQAIRFQGDLESSMRIGWGIPYARTKALPSHPGLICFYDHERKLTHLTSAVQINKEIQAYKNLEALPKPLLKIILKSYDLQFQSCANSLEALYKESDALSKHNNLAYKPQHFHQRQPPCLSLTKEYSKSDKGPEKQNFTLKLTYGPIGPHTLAAIGPVRERKLALNLLKSMGEHFGSDLRKQSIILPPELEPLMAAFLERSLPTYKKKISSLSRRLLSLVKNLTSPLSNTAPSIRDHLTFLENIEFPVTWRNLLDLHGLIIAKDHGRGQWQLYPIAFSQPLQAPRHIQGDIVQKLKRAGYGRRLIQHIANAIDQKKKKKAKSSDAGISSKDADMIGSTIWWILAHESIKDSEDQLELFEDYEGAHVFPGQDRFVTKNAFGLSRGEGIFIPLSDCQKLCT